jgi:hypothetical protein
LRFIGADAFKEITGTYLDPDKFNEIVRIQKIQAFVSAIQDKDFQLRCRMFASNNGLDVNNLCCIYGQWKESYSNAKIVWFVSYEKFPELYKKYDKIMAFL